MRRVLFAMLLVAAPHGVSDLTWDFAESWAAQESAATATVVSSPSIVSSVRLDADSTQSQPSVVIITGEVQDPRSREIMFRYESPAALESSEQRVALDSLDSFSFELPVVRGTLVSGYFEDQQPRWQWVDWLGSFLFEHRWLGSFFFEHRFLRLFVEPGDSLHVAMEEGFFGPFLFVQRLQRRQQPLYFQVDPAIPLLTPRSRRIQGAGGRGFQASNGTVATGSVRVLGRGARASTRCLQGASTM